MEPLRAAVLRTLAFHAAWGYAPTRLQLLLSLDAGNDAAAISSIGQDEVFLVLDELISQDIAVEMTGRAALKSYVRQIDEGRGREIFFPRKLRNARRAAAYLRRVPGVRAVCLCNTVALGQSNDKSDLDFFILTHSGVLWRTRFFCATPFKLLGARPGARSVDPVCLSFFVSDQALDLSPLALTPDDPYFRYWLLFLLPLSDDGVLDQLWQANAALLSRHPFAKKWIALDAPNPHPYSQTRDGRRETVDGRSQETVKPERFWRWLQWKMFPMEIRALANQDTRVVCNNDVLKFHVTDQRDAFRERYGNNCHELGVEE